MICLYLLFGTFMLLSAIFVVAADFLTSGGVSLAKKEAAPYYNQNNSPIQLAGKVNISALNNNSTPLTNSSHNPLEIHKPLNPKSPEEIQLEKEHIQRNKHKNYPSVPELGRF